MIETKKKKILKSKENLFQAGQKVGYKEGAPIEKGVVLNEEIAVKWVKNGAQFSDTVKALLKEKDIFNKAKATKGE